MQIRKFRQEVRYAIRGQQEQACSDCLTPGRLVFHRRPQTGYRVAQFNLLFVRLSLDDLYFRKDTVLEHCGGPKQRLRHPNVSRMNKTYKKQLVASTATTTLQGRSGRIHKPGIRKLAHLIPLLVGQTRWKLALRTCDQQTQFGSLSYSILDQRFGK